MTLTCQPSGDAPALFTGVAFASFGAPAGSCASGLAINSSCHAADSLAVVSAACVGKAECKLQALTSAFGGQDPCLDVVKRLAVALEGPCSGPSFQLQATVPAGATAVVRVPTPLASAAVTITEGGAAVWRAGAFVPGVAGISGGAAVADGIAFAVGSGAYSFAVLDA